MTNQQLKEEFLNTHIFHGLKNLNDGFDVASIKYFSASDFRIVLERVEEHNLGIHGIEPWKNGTYFDVYGPDDYSKNPDDPEWYNVALSDFIETGEDLVYAATYYIPHLDDDI